MKETYNIGTQDKVTGKYTFRTSKVLSRDHLVRNLGRMLSEGKIQAWKIYDGPNADWLLEYDKGNGWF